MRQVSSDNFGPMIAYVVPGVTALLGAAELSATVRSWFAGSASATPTVGGFLYVTLAAVAAGLTVSTLRWAFLDTLHHATGIRKPQWDFARLEANIEAFHLIVEHQYRHYQWHGNMLVSCVFVFTARRLAHGLVSFTLGDIGILVLIGILFVGSRDTLRKYYERGERIMGHHVREIEASGETRSASEMPSPTLLDSPRTSGRATDTRSSHNGADHQLGLGPADGR